MLSELYHSLYLRLWIHLSLFFTLRTIESCRLTQFQKPAQFLSATLSLLDCLESDFIVIDQTWPTFERLFRIRHRSSNSLSVPGILLRREWLPCQSLNQLLVCVELLFVLLLSFIRRSTLCNGVNTRVLQVWHTSKHRVLLMFLVNLAHRLYRTNHPRRLHIIRVLIKELVRRLWWHVGALDSTNLSREVWDWVYSYVILISWFRSIITRGKVTTDPVVSALHNNLFPFNPELFMA